MDTGNRTAILYITDNGLGLSERLRSLYPDAQIFRYKSGIVAEIWNKNRNLIFIMAAGIVVRAIAPLIKDKRWDPAVVVLDEAGRYAISLLSGHIGGGNELAREIASFLGGEAVITTASDVNNMTSVDLWSERNNLVIENWGLVPQIGTRLINNGALRVYTEIDIELPDEFLRVVGPRFGDVLITNKRDIYRSCLSATHTSEECPMGQCRLRDQLYLRPKNLVIGIGCNSGTSTEEIEDAVKRVLEEHNLSPLSLSSIATIDKKGNEPGLVAFAERYNLPIDTYTPDELNSMVDKSKNIGRSGVVFDSTGAYAVAEPAALLSAGSDRLIVPKQKIGNVTIAVAESTTTVSRHPNAPALYIVGIGPGGIEHITPYAQAAIRRSDVIVGYEVYLELIHELITDKEVVSTGMTQEVERCQRAIDLALSGMTVSIISGGDPGIYAMAGLVLDLLRRQAVGGWGALEIDKGSSHSNRRAIKSLIPRVEVIPGISALNACAARLGAPLMHDFAVISLSDRLTPWELIERRLTAVAASDFVTVLYNPKSMGRPEHIDVARDIFLRHRRPETPVGIVRGAMRENEMVIITNLAEMLNYEIDMQTTVIIGNSQTFIWNDWMITPRGYEKRLCSGGA